MKTFILSLQFMTRIPININLDVKREDFQATVKFFPIVGLIIGALEALIYFIALNFISVSAASYITVLTHVIVTGGIHIDGFSDTLDGIFSGRNKDRILEIMKDSRVGTFGALGIALLIIGKIILIMNLKTPIIAILIAPIISRTMNIFLMYNQKYARATEGMGDMFIGVLTKNNYYICLILGIALTLTILKLKGLFIFICCIFFTILFRNYIKSKIDGITGDILGASDELNELLIYLILCIIR